LDWQYGTYDALLRNSCFLWYWINDICHLENDQITEAKRRAASIGPSLLSFQPGINPLINTFGV
jgi:hypothetical protein